MASSSNIARHCFKSECYSLTYTKSVENPLFASSFADGTVKIWDLNQINNENKSIEEPLHVIKNAIELAPVDIKFDSNGKRLACTSMDGSLKVFEIDRQGSGEIESKMLFDSTMESQNQQDADGSSSYLLDPWKVCFNPKHSGQFITGQLNLQCVETNDKGYSIKKEIKHNKYINCMDYASNNMVATGDIDGAVKIIDLGTADFKTHAFNNHGLGVRTVKFSPDGKSIISGSEDLHMHICDVETQQRTLTLVNHADWITSIDFNPQNPQYFVSSSLDNTIKIWNDKQNKEIKTLNFSEPIWSAQFSPDGNFINVASQSGTISLVSFVKD